MNRLTIPRRSLLATGAAALVVREAGLPAAASPAVSPPFATDIRLPGLLHAVMARPPVLGARLESFDAASALRVRGVVEVFRLPPFAETGGGPRSLFPFGGVAVLARDTWSALRGRDALAPRWIAAFVRPAPMRPSSFLPATAEPLFERPSACARVGQGRCAVWSCLEHPEQVRVALAAILGLPVGTVSIHRCAGVGGFANPAYAFEAARLSAMMAGRPISLAWTREDDMPLRASQNASPEA